MRARGGAALAAAAAAALTIGGCATVPGGPTVAALPGQYKPFEQFRLDDADCRQYASSQVSGNTQSANEAAAGTAVLSSALGAASGAIIGSATGQAGPAAAVGAGIGLLFGSIAGGNQAYASTYGLQQRLRRRLWAVHVRQGKPDSGAPARSRRLPDVPQLSQSELSAIPELSGLLE
jgi:hypothetical protein